MTSFQNSVSKNIKLQPSSVISKDFSILNYNLHYQNKYYFKDPEKPQIQLNNIVVSNILAQKFNNQFKKITEIHLGNKIIVLEDNYELNQIFSNLNFNKVQPSEADTYNPDAVSLELSQKQSHFGQFSQNEQFRRKDKKNVVKNIVKSFASWLKLAHQNPEILKCEQFKIEQIRQYIDVIEDLVKDMKFNNRLIVTLINHKVLAYIFEYFLKNQALKWIKQSKINDKISHIEAIQLYLKTYSSGKVESLRILKKGKK